MNEHDQYMHDFMRVFEGLDYWGPSSEADTCKAYNMLCQQPKRILEVGCGNGNATITLAKLSNATIIASDNEQSALDRLGNKLTQLNLTDQVSTKCISMAELNFGRDKFDVIWAEASAYIMGVENALKNWKPLLDNNGVLVFSDLVWLTDKPSEDAVAHWQKDYPDMQSINKRISQINSCGYELLQTFTMSEQAWKNYYEPLQARVAALASEMNGSKAVADIQQEIQLYKTRLGEFGYQFFIAQKC